MRKLLVVSTLLVFVCAWAGAASGAGLSTLDQLEVNLRAVGVTFSRSQSPSGTELIVRGDQERLFQSIPALQLMDVMNPDLTQTQLNNAPISFSGLTLVAVVVAEIQALYKDVPSVDRLHCRAVMQVPDDYGRLKSRNIFSFSFNRALYQKIDWEHFLIARFPKIAPGFRLSSWFSDQVDSEGGAGF